MPDDGIREELRAINITLRDLISCLSEKFREPPSLEAQAIALLLRDGPNVAQVARTLGVPRQRLYRLPRFVECLERLTGPRRVRKGFKVKGGGLEGVNDD